MIKRHLEASMTRTIELLERLVAFETTSSRSNSALIDFMQPMLEGCGAKVRRVTDATGSKTAIHAVLGYTSPTRRRIHEQLFQYKGGL
jgi:hypothetical protein